MDKLILEGGQKLQGTIRVSGAKNAVLPILAATLLYDQAVFIENIPHLNDVTTMLELLGRLGVKFILRDELAIEVDAATVHSVQAPYDLVRTMRASILVLGPLLARFGCAEISLPGGCAIGSRPVDVHVMGMQALGAEVKLEDGFIKATVNGRLRGAEIDLGKITVTGTENILMAAVLAEGTTTIHHAACEPEVTDLANMLNQSGARIKGVGTNTLIIEGVKKLTPTTYRVMPDRIEAGTYLVAATMCSGAITLNNACPEVMAAVLERLQATGAHIEISGQSIHLDMQGKRPQAVDIITSPYPMFPTDMQAQFLALNSIAEGEATVTENVFENRFMHVPELKRMGADIQLDGQKVYSKGVESLKGAPVMATDLRASASLLLAGLVAEGTTIVNRVYHLDRGYECIEEKLASLGANIRRVTTKQRNITKEVIDDGVIPAS